jgi:hypothetical protein
MTSMTTNKPQTAGRTGVAQLRDWLSPLNLHWAGVGLLVVVNLYLIGQMIYLWHGSSNYDADAIAQQKIALQRAEAAAEPLRGLDAKLDRAGKEADRFYVRRLPATDSDVVGELGVLTKKAGVRLTGATYTPTPALAGSAGELTELRIDARLSGDYRPLVMLMNSLERDQMFFVINAVTLTGQQTGSVNLRLGMTTYLRNGASDEPGVAGMGDGAPAAAAGGQGE